MENGKAPAVIEASPGAGALIKVADALWKSSMFPNVKNAFGAFAVVQYGAELGIGPMTSLQNMSVVQGKICMSAQMMLTLAVKNGVNYNVIESTDKKAIIRFKGDTEYVSEFSIEDAKRAGIFKAQGGWEKYPKNMCFWRSVTQGIRVVKPGVVAGLYSKEELEDAPPLNAPVSKEEPQAEVVDTKTGEIQPQFDKETWLDRMVKARAKLGDIVYYEILTGRYEVEHAEDVTDETEAKSILDEMIEAFKSKAA